MTRVLFSVLLGASVVACAPTYRVVRQASVNPLTKSVPIFVEPMSFDGLYVETLPEADYLGRYAASGAMRTFKSDKEGMDQRYREAVSRVVPPASLDGSDFFRLRARAVQIVPGGDVTAGSIGKDTRGRFAVQLVGNGGVVLDEIEIDVSILASQTAPLAGDRMQQLGERLADTVIAYLKTRSGK